MFAPRNSEHSLKSKLKTSVSINSSSITYNELFLKYTKWSHFFILYWGMWTTQLPPSHNKRSSILNTFAIFFTSILYIYFVAFNLHYYIITANIIPTMFVIMSVMMQISTTIMKIISMYYFVFKFNYPWYDKHLFHLNSFQNVSKEYMEKRLKSTSIRLKVIFIFSIFTSCYWAYYSCIGKVNYGFLDYNNTNPLFVYKWYTRGILSIAILYTIALPSFFTIYVISIVFLKYELYLHGLNVMVEGSEYQKIRFDEVIVEYGKVYKSLHDGNYMLWQIFFATMFVGTFALIWYFIASMVEYFDYMKFIFRFYLVSMVCMLLWLGEFIYSGSFVTQEFDKFKRLLIDVHGDKSKIWTSFNDFDMNERISNIHSYHCFVRYIGQYPLNVTVFGWKVSNANLVRFVLFFVIAKGISYSLYTI